MTPEQKSKVAADMDAAATALEAWIASQDLKGPMALSILSLVIARIAVNKTNDPFLLMGFGDKTKIAVDNCIVAEMLKKLMEK